MRETEGERSRLGVRVKFSFFSQSRSSRERKRERTGGKRSRNRVTELLEKEDQYLSIINSVGEATEGFREPSDEPGQLSNRYLLVQRTETREWC